MRKVGVIVLAFCCYLAWKTSTSWPDRLTRVVFCNVGQGDATLITQGFTQVLVDGGPDEAVLGCLRNHMPWWDRSIETVVATHADADHIAGLPSVLSRYQVKNVLMTDQYKKTAEFQALLARIRQEKGIKVNVSVPGERLLLGSQTVLNILWPSDTKQISFLHGLSQTETQLSVAKDDVAQNKDEYNNGSIVLILQMGEVRVLLTGDLEAEGESALLAAGLTKHIHVLKVGHHGSKTSTTQSFIDQVQPEYAVISCGVKNRFGHPAPEVLTRLEDSGARVLRTDLEGEIVLASDGLKYWFTY